MRKNTWHYKLAKMGNQGNAIWSEEVSICEYTRKVMFGGILFLFMIALVGVLFTWFGWALFEIVGAIFGFSTLGPPAAVLLGCVTFIAGLMALSWIKDKWESKRRYLLKKENHSFLADAYKSYKEKICFAVKFEDE